MSLMTDFNLLVECKNYAKDWGYLWGNLLYWAIFSSDLWTVYKWAYFRHGLLGVNSIVTILVELINFYLRNQK